MPLCEEMATFAAAVPTYGGTVGTDFFAYKLPADPDRAVAVFAYFSGASQRVFCKDPTFERLRFQLQVRGAFGEGEDQLAYARIYGLHRALDVVVDRTIGGARYVGIEAVQPPFELPRDANERLVLAANYEAWRVPA